MAERFFTTESIEKQIIEIQKVMNFSTKASIIRVCVALSLQVDSDPKLAFDTVLKDNSGMNYHRATIMGDDDEIYRVVFSLHLGRDISEEEFFPSMLKAHLIRGMAILYNYFKFNESQERMYVFLAEKLGGKQ